MGQTTKAKKILKNLKKSVDKSKWLWYYNRAPCEGAQENGP